MFCSCCVLPIILNLFGFVATYKLNIFIFFLQIIFLYINIAYYKQKENLLHIYIAIIINIMLGFLSFNRHRIPWTTNSINTFSKTINMLGFINMSIFFYKSLTKKNNKKSCSHKKCQH